MMEIDMLTVKTFRNGNSVDFERANGWWHVNARRYNGELIDKVRCDDYRDALAYRRAFCDLARNDRSMFRQAV